MSKQLDEHVQDTFRFIFWTAAFVLAGFSAFAAVTALQGDENGSSAAIVLGAAAILVFALTKPTAWLAGRVITSLTVLVRRVNALIPWHLIPLPRVRLPEWATRGAAKIPMVLPLDEPALLAVIFASRDNRWGKPENPWLPAEMLAESHMRAHGFPDARLSEPRGSEGADVVAETAVARVATRTEPVDTPMVRRLGDTHPELPVHLFYSTSGFTRIAVVTANKIGVALLHIDNEGTISPVNKAPRRPV